jgi:uncharacterized phage protein gp47/JayE
MNLSTKNFATLVSDFAAAVQGRATALLDFTTGSILRAVSEAVASQALWLQSVALAVLSVTRAATSVGPDLDSFVGDYGLTRDPAIGAIGTATFARFTAASSALLPVGTQVQTSDGTQTFAVTVDTTNPNWSAGQNGYVIPAGTASITVPIQAITAGSASNVVAGSITLILSAVPGVDTVTNAAPLENGEDAESDTALRIRFRAFIASLASATETAIVTAVQGVQTGLTVQALSNVNRDGSVHLGYVTVIVDDGSGNPPGSLLAAAATAIDGVIGEGIAFGVFGPSLVTANVAVVLTLASGYSLSVVGPLVQASVSAYMASLGLGAGLSYTRLYQVIYDTSPGITDATGLSVNAGAVDIAGLPGVVIRAGSVTVT